MRLCKNSDRIDGRRMSVFAAAIFIAAASMGCDDDDEITECIPGTAEGCADGFVCEETTYGESEPTCFAPVTIRGAVFDLASDIGIGGALVIARDANGAAMGSVATTDVDGSYRLLVPVVRIDEQGGFAGSVITLRVDAAGYMSYPGGFRPSLPIDLDDAMPADSDSNGEPDELTVDTPTTDVALIPLTGDTVNLGSISGIAHEGFGALIVAEGTSGAVTGVADSEGNYAVLNVPAGTYTLAAYASGRQFAPLTVEIAQGEDKTGVNFEPAAEALCEVAGSVNIVNAPGGSITSVVLAVEATFNDTFARGEVPPGLRAGEVTGAFTIAGVPDGKYVVLAAFENDNLVRDPDTSIAGTQLVHIEVSGGGLVNSETLSFKVTEALATNSPGAEEPEAVTGSPTFSWADDSSEDEYSLIVYDAFGQTVWEMESIPGVSGDPAVTLDYGGPALEPGLYYQWRATSIKDGVPISTTEDLRGLFYLQ